jgi:hypothetical protein
VRTGYLTCNGERVVLSHCSRLLADLLRTIHQLEEDFAERCGVDPDAGRDMTSRGRGRTSIPAYRGITSMRSLPCTTR